MKFAPACILLATCLAITACYAAEDKSLRITFTPTGKKPEAGNPNLGDVEFQKEIAPVVAESLKGYADARSRYLAGPATADTFHVFVRLRGRDDRIELGELKVLKIDPAAATVTGKIVSGKFESETYRHGQEVTVSEAQVVDWLFRRSDGTEEHGSVRQFLAGRGGHAEVSKLLTDQREIDIEVMDGSRELTHAIEEAMRSFFNEPSLRIEKLTNDRLVDDWPALKEHYRGIRPADILADLNAKAEAGKSVRRVTVEDKRKDREPMANVAFYIYLKRSGRIFEVRQFLHFAFRGEHELDNVGWGLRTVRIVKPKIEASPEH